MLECGTQEERIASQTQQDMGTYSGSWEGQFRNRRESTHLKPVA